MLAFGLPVMAYGVIYNTLLIAAGAAIVLLAMFGWGLEPHTATDEPTTTRRRPTRVTARNWRWPPMADAPPCTTPVEAGGWVVADEDDHGHHTSTGLSNNKLAMWLFLGSECLLFGGLISTYMLYRGRHSENLGPDQVWDIPFTSASSFVLLMSSLTMVLAVSAANRKDDRNTNLWLDRDRAARLAVRRRSGVRVHHLLPRGPRLHDEPVLVELLHPHRFPRGARVGRASSCCSPRWA